MNAKIHRHNGVLLGAALWVPASVIEKHITRPGQDEIEVSFDENRIIIEKEETIGELPLQMNISIKGKA